MYDNAKTLCSVEKSIGPAPATQSETAYAAQVLDSAISRVEARVTDLMHKLQPVIEDRPQKGVDADQKAERQMFSPLGRGLIETSYRIETIERRINALLDSIAI